MPDIVQTLVDIGAKALGLGPLAEIEEHQLGFTLCHDLALGCRLELQPVSRGQLVSLDLDNTLYHLKETCPPGREFMMDRPFVIDPRHIDPGV